MNTPFLATYPVASSYLFACSNHIFHQLAKDFPFLLFFYKHPASLTVNLKFEGWAHSVFVWNEAHDQEKKCRNETRPTPRFNWVNM